MQSQSNFAPAFSCEFFPPNDNAGLARLQRVREQLSVLKPDFFSVTYGAGGTTRNRTFEAVLDIQQNSGIDAAPHLTCVASTRESVLAILDYYRNNGIHRIIALRGDRNRFLQICLEFFRTTDVLAVNKYLWHRFLASNGADTGQACVPTKGNLLKIHVLCREHLLCF